MDSPLLCIVVICMCSIENRQERSEVEAEKISGFSQDLNPGASEFSYQLSYWALKAAECRILVPLGTRLNLATFASQCW